MLIYPAIALSNEHVIVSNGEQTKGIVNCTDYVGIVARLMRGTQNYEFEPDEPNYTPRISVCIYPYRGIVIGIIKRGIDRSVIRDYQHRSFRSGIGWGIATYAGENKNPLPSFEGNPIQISLDFESLEEAVETVYNLLAPKNGKDDFRVSVAGVIHDGHLNNFFDTYIKNRF